MSISSLLTRSPLLAAATAAAPFGKLNLVLVLALRLCAASLGVEVFMGATADAAFAGEEERRRPLLAAGGGRGWTLECPNSSSTLSTSSQRTWPPGI